MTGGRVNPFGALDEVPVFETKPRSRKPVDANAVDMISIEQNFPSRKAQVPTLEPRKTRRYTTGRNRQLNFKVTTETADRFYAMADSRGLKLCELLEKALDALSKDSR